MNLLLGCTLAFGCAPAPAPIPSRAKPVEPAATIAEENDAPAPAESSAPPATDPKRESLAGLGKTGECKACLPGTESRCAEKRGSCADAPSCLAYLECVRRCPDPSARDVGGGYPQADCVIACREKSTDAAELGDGYLWCVCCESPCKGACGAECGHFKSGIAGPIGAGCD